MSNLKLCNFSRRFEIIFKSKPRTSFIFFKNLIFFPFESTSEIFLYPTIDKTTPGRPAPVPISIIEWFLFLIKAVNWRLSSMCFDQGSANVDFPTKLVWELYCIMLSIYFCIIFSCLESMEYLVKISSLFNRLGCLVVFLFFYIAQ